MATMINEAAKPSSQENNSSPSTVRDPETGVYLIVHGAGALKGSSFAIKKGVDLTKPIAAQVLKKGRIDRSSHKG